MALVKLVKKITAVVVISDRGINTDKI